MAHKHDARDEDELDDEDDMDEESDEMYERRGHRRSPWVQFLAAVGFIAIGAIVVPAVWGVVAEAPNLRRYLRIMRM